MDFKCARILFYFDYWICDLWSAGKDTNICWNFERFQKCYHELNSKLIIFKGVVHSARGFKISVKPHILKTVGRKILVRTSVYYVEKALVALEIE